jgi:hypothetical protein
MAQIMSKSGDIKRKSSGGHGHKPEDHGRPERPQPKDEHYRFSRYSTIDQVKILVQENRIRIASSVGSLTSCLVLVR